MEGNRAATKLTVYITEDALGNFDVAHEAIDLQTGKPVPMRMSHITGQLYQAANMLSLDYYDSLRAQVQQKVQVEVKPKKSK